MFYIYFLITLPLPFITFYIYYIFAILCYWYPDCFWYNWQAEPPSLPICLSFCDYLFMLISYIPIICFSCLCVYPSSLLQMCTVETCKTRSVLFVNPVRPDIRSCLCWSAHVSRVSGVQGGPSVERIVAIKGCSLHEIRLSSYLNTLFQI